MTKQKFLRFCIQTLKHNKYKQNMLYSKNDVSDRSMIMMITSWLYFQNKRKYSLMGLFKLIIKQMKDTNQRMVIESIIFYKFEKTMDLPMSMNMQKN